MALAIAVAHRRRAHVVRRAAREDYYLPGTIARVLSPIRARGTGEIMYVKGGTRQVAAARSIDGEPIARGTEVVIVRYELGIAYVHPWDDTERQYAALQ
jgi:hypothetical protein